MGFEAKCVCSKHSTWHHGDISAASLRIASKEEPQQPERERFAFHVEKELLLNSSAGDMRR